MKMTSFDPTYQKYPSRRYPLFAKNGMVNCSTPQAAAAGLEILKKGGNAMDAIVAAAAALTVVEPTANGIGSDAFSLIWVQKEQKLYGISSNGPSPRALSPQAMLADGKDDHGKVPKYGWTPVCVPGCVKAWTEITGCFGKLPLTVTLAPAIRYAEEGFPLGAAQARVWRDTLHLYQNSFHGEEFGEWFRTFAPEGRPYEAGELVKLPNHAKTLREIAETNGESCYTGRLDRAIDADSRAHGGYLRYEDLASYHARWVEPARVNYRGYTVCEIPPSGQGTVALMALNILNNFRFPEKDCAETYHKQIEAMKLAFADGLHYISDPEDMRIDYHDLLKPGYGKERAAEIGARAEVRMHGEPNSGGTVYLCCADAEGNMVSYIQSNYKAFGSGIVVKDTGISLSNRGFDFSMDPEHVNYLRPGKYTYHTIIPGFLLKDGEAVGPFGVMGAYMQPQGHVQVLMNYIDFNMDPQQALDAPRWQWIREKEVLVESAFSSEIAWQLKDRGHDISLELSPGGFGKGQMIIKLPNGVYCGGTESRYDGSIALY